MHVRQVDLTLDLAGREVPGQRPAQLSNARASVQNDERIGSRADFDAGGVATVPDRARPRCRNGTTCPPEPQSQSHVRRASALGGNNGKRDRNLKGRQSPVTCDYRHIVTCGLGRAARARAGRQG